MDDRDKWMQFEARGKLPPEQMAELTGRILEAAPLGILVYDGNGDCVLANEKAARTVGATQAQLLAQNFNRIASWQVSGLLGEARLCLDRGERRHSLIHVTTTFGREIWIDCRLVPLGTVEERHVLLLFEDVTERKRAQAEAAAHQRTIEAVNSLFREALACSTPMEVGRRFIDIAKDVTASRLGWLCELDAQGRVKSALLDPDAREMCRMVGGEPIDDGRLDRSSEQMACGRMPPGILRRALALGRTQIVNRPDQHAERLGFPEGHVAIDNLLLVPLRRGETAFGLLALANKAGRFRDEDALALEALAAAYVEVRDRRESDARVAFMAKELAWSNEDLELFASVASHDLREPLRKVLVFGERLSRELGESLGPAGADFLARMTQAAGRMRTLVDGLLEYSRAGSAPTRPSSVDMDALLRGVVADLEVPLGECGGTVELEACPPVLGDPVQVRQIFQNLIENSIRHRRVGRPPEIRVTSGIDGASVAIEVSDNGIGFDEAEGEKIFLPFYRSPSGTSPGTGLGLAVVRRLVGRNGGRIRARGIPGQGAVFSLVLPLAPDDLEETR